MAPLLTSLISSCVARVKPRSLMIGTEPRKNEIQPRRNEGHEERSEKTFVLFVSSWFIFPEEMNRCPLHITQPSAVAFFRLFTMIVRAKREHRLNLSI